MTFEEARRINNELFKVKLLLDKLGLERTRGHEDIYLQLGKLMGTIARVSHNDTNGEKNDA